MAPPSEIPPQAAPSTIALNPLRSANCLVAAHREFRSPVPLAEPHPNAMDVKVQFE